MNEEAFEQAQQAWIDDFHERIEGLRRDGVADFPPLGSTIPWADVSEQRKLEAVIWESMIESVREESVDRLEATLEMIGVPGGIALEAVERNIDYAGLPPAQRAFLENLRDRLESGEFDQSPEEDPKDFVKIGLTRVVGIDHFDRMLDAHGSHEENPWRDRSEVEKLAYILDAASEAGPPGTYTLAAIEREVDYDGLPPWRRSGLERLRREIDADIFHHENPDPATNDDPVDRALRCIELKARIEEHKRFGVLDGRGERQAWDSLDETAKFDRIMEEIDDLQLHADARAFAQIVAEVDRSRIPLDKRREFEEQREQTWLWREFEHDEFDDVVADLRQHWYDDGLAAMGERWEDKPVLYKIAYLADFAAAMEVPYERFAAAAENLIANGADPHVASNQEWFMARTFFDTQFRYAQRHPASEPLPFPEATRSAQPEDGTAEAGGGKTYRSPSDLRADVLAGRVESDYTHEHDVGLDYER